MALADELLAHARWQLMPAEIDHGTEAAFRRAVSTAYYALFHLLIDSAAKVFISGQQSDALRAAVRRTFVHGRMMEACHAFVRGKHKLSHLLSSSPPPELQAVCQTFIDLQEARHRADYDTSFTQDWRDAALSFSATEKAFQQWSLIRNTEDARVFLVALLLWKDLRD